MSGLLYFFPGVEKDRLASADAFHPGFFAEYGLEASLADVVRWPADGMVTSCVKGPSGAAGALLAPLAPGIDTDQVQCLYKPDQQTWLPIAGGKFWLGFWVDKLPVAAELARSRTFVGYTVTDANGQRWAVPVARSHDGVTCSLPSYHHFDPETLELRRNLQPEYASLWEIAGKVFEHLTDQWPEESPPPEPQDLVRWAVTALACNYRIGPAEIVALQAAGRNPLDHEAVGNILISLCDQAVFQTTLKNLPAGVAPAVPASTCSTITAAAGGRG